MYSDTDTDLDFFFFFFFFKKINLIIYFIIYYFIMNFDDQPLPTSSSKNYSLYFDDDKNKDDINNNNNNNDQIINEINEDEEGYSKTLTFFKEKDEVFLLFKELWNNGKEKGLIIEDRARKILEEYQEQPQLLAPFIPSLLDLLTPRLIAALPQDNSVPTQVIYLISPHFLLYLLLLHITYNFLI